MNQLAATVVPLSLGAMISPTLLTAVVLVLSGRVAPRARAWSFNAGAATILLAFTLAVPLLVRTFGATNPRLVDGVDVGLGVLLLGLGVWTLVRRKPSASATRRAPKKTAAATPSLGEYFAFGAAMIATDFSSLVLYVAAIKDISRAHIVVGARLAVALLPFIAVLAPALVPALFGTVAPRESDRLLRPVAAWVGKYAKTITVAVSLVFGVYLIAKGAWALMR